MARFFDREGLRPLLAAAVPDGRTSPNQIPVVDIVLALFAAVLTGGRRFAHVERLRADRFVQTVLGLSRMPSAMTGESAAAAPSVTASMLPAGSYTYARLTRLVCAALRNDRLASRPVAAS